MFRSIADIDYVINDVMTVVSIFPYFYFSILGTIIAELKKIIMNLNKMQLK